VDGAIHRKGGPDILRECKEIRESYYPDGLPAGHAVITTGGYLKAKKVIHTVGPVWHGGINKEPKVLAAAYKNCLKVALRTGSRPYLFHPSARELMDTLLKRQAGSLFGLSLGS